MRNFTLGKMRIPLFFFALFLFSGTYSSYGQCPIVDGADSTQYFCDSQEAEISSLTVTDANGADVVWYLSQTATTPIPSTRFLVNGTTYYAGTADGSCAGNRAAVTASIASEPEILGIRASTTPATAAQRRQSLAVIGVCVADVNNPGLTISDLRTNAADEDQVNWYYTRTATEPIPAGTPLQNNTDYFAALVSEDGNCETNRRRTTVRFFSEPAPTGPAIQDFCAINNPILGNIEATGENRYFSTENSQTELSPNTALVDGRTYYISAVGENCESAERLAVTVNVEEPMDLQTTSPGIVCELNVSETFPSIDAIEDYYLGLLGEGVPTNGTLNPTAAQMAANYQNDEDGLGDFTTTYTVGCDQVDLTISIIAAEEANAGGDVERTYEVTQGPVNLFGLLTNGAQSTGTFEGYPDGLFDPSTEGPGSYIFEYVVDETSGCIVGSDSAIFDITVTPCQDNAGDDVAETFCLSEAQTLAAQLVTAQTDEQRAAVLAQWLGERDTDGTFSGDPAADFIQQYSIGNFPITVSTIYTVGEGICEDTADISLTIVQDVDAGGDGEAELSPEDAPVNLFSYLTGTPDEGGTWSPGNGSFDPATDAAGTFTYTVGTEGCTDSADVVVTLTADPTDPTDPGVTPGFGVVCEADVQTLFPSVDAIRNYYLRLLPSGVQTNGTLNPTAAQLASMYQADEDGLGTFTTIYTATNGETFELSVSIVTQAEAGESKTVTLTTDSEPVNLFESLGPDALPGGTWSSGNGTFDPATDEAGTFTYTVGYEGCMDSATITVIVNEPTDPTDPNVTPGFGVICQADVQTFFPSIDAIRNYYLRLLPSDVQTNGTLNPTAAQLASMYQADEDGLGTFTTVYTATNGETYELTVNIVSQAEAGESNTVTLTTEDEPVNLFESLGADALPGGTWSSGNGMFDPATDEPGTFTYTVGYEGCMDSETITVVVNNQTDPCAGVVDAGTDSRRNLCETDVQATFPSVDEIRKYFLGLLDAGISRAGTLNPTASQLATMYQNDEDGLGEFTTVYTLVNGDCSDSVELTVNIIPVEEANAGTIAGFEVCTSTESLDLFSYLSDDASQGGTFFDAAGNEIQNGALDISSVEEYTLTYTVSEDDANSCVTGTDSVEFTVTVVENTANAGADNSRTACNSEVKNLTPGGVRNLFLGLLETGVDRAGTFNPTIQQLIDQYNFQSNIGDFTTLYTVTDGSCTDSAELTVTVLASLTAGEDNLVTLEEDATEVVDLFDELGGSPDEGGVWTFDGNVVDEEFDPATDAEGQYMYTVTSENGCTDSAIVTVQIGEPIPCPEVTEPTQTVCEGTTIEVLLPTNAVWYDAADATTPLADGTVLTDGGEYFAGDADGTCDTRGMVTVTFAATPDAPSVNNFEDCVVAGATVADLEITGEDGATFTVYSDETLVTEVDETAVLTDGTYYATQTNAAGCESAAAVITVTLADSAAPTLGGEGSTFCEFDDATVAELEERINAAGDVTWYTTATGTETFSDADVLVNGRTYYAASTDGECESSQRLPVTVTLEVCEIIIPEAFSPNGDDINDEFVIENIASEYPSFRLEIYNRWGEPVYKGGASTPEWDGTSTEGSFGSGVLPAGVYFYILYFNDGQTAPTQGRVYLSR